MFEIINDDCRNWLKKQPDESISNFVTGIPDLNELKDLTFQEYIEFFHEVVQLIFDKVKSNGYCIFIQTDRKINKTWFDKSFHLSLIADENDINLMWHKIVCLREPGKIDLHRPSYAHFICYSKKGTPGVAFPDIIPISHQNYANATPQEVAKLASNFIYSKIESLTNTSGFDVVDPFVGKGTIGVYMTQQGLSFLGIDIDPQQCEYSRKNIFKISNRFTS